MRLTLSLTGSELQSFAYICKYVGGTSATEFALYAIAVSHENLATKLNKKLIAGTSHKRHSITLDDMQVYAVYILLPRAKRDFGIYERLLVDKILSEIDKKFQRELLIKQSLKSI